MSLLIRNARVVTEKDDCIVDVFAEHESISLIGESLQVTADTVIDATGRLLIPGGIDPHTHLDMPMGEITSSDDFETGTRAAAFGGTTTIIDFPTQTKGCSTLEALDQWHDKAAGKACVDYGFHMIVSDMPKERLKELDQLVSQGITSFKLFMAYPALIMDDGSLFRTMCHAAELGAMVAMHAENGPVIDELRKQALETGNTSPVWHARTRPSSLEAEAVFRSIAIAELAKASLYIVHTSSGAAMDQIAAARNRGAKVYGETCPQYLFLDESSYDEPGFEGAKYVMSPPLRPKGNSEQLWQGLVKGDLQVVATDHCPFTLSDKERGRDDFTRIPNGAPGIENRMALVYDGAVSQKRMSLNRFVEITSTNAAKLFGMYPRKGTIEVGSDADLVVFNPSQEQTISVRNAATHHMNVDYTSYEGIKVRGYPETVISRGRVICNKGEFSGTPGWGRFIKRNAPQIP